MDNQHKATIFFQARTKCLPLNESKKYVKEDTKCRLCNAENEDITHFMLNCPVDIKERNMSIYLQQPYDRDILGKFLFEKEDMEEKKETLCKLWKRRRLEMNRLLPTLPSH